ncbi:hypothetical protein GCM10025734_03540 [Kitasatospora paranensis]
MQVEVGGARRRTPTVGVNRAANGFRCSEARRTSATRSHHRATGASRPVITAPGTTTVNDI